MSAPNTAAAPAASVTPAANNKGSLLGGITSLFGGKPANAKNASANAGANAKNAGANAKNASANANANAKNASANANAANAKNAAEPPALKPAEVAKSLNAPAGAAARTRRRQRGGARGKTMRLPGTRNVLRVTGKTVGKIRNVGVYGLKKVGNGVHMVTGLVGAVLRKGGKTLKNITKRRQQTRKQ
jgi:hypothetical protein